MTNEAPSGWIDSMEELAGAAADFRAAVPAGTHLGSEYIDDAGGSHVDYTKAKGKVRMAGIEMPERIPLYNTATRLVKMVPPTIAQARIMKGTKAYPPSVFSLRKPADWTEPDPIDDTCPVCTAKRKVLGREPKRFYDAAQLDAHFESLHPRAFRTAERRRESDQKSEDQALMRELIGSIRDALNDRNVTDEEAEAIAEDAIAQRRGPGRPRKTDAVQE